MRTKYFIVLLVLIILLAGCQSRSKTINTVSEDPNTKKTIMNADEFQNLYKDWANRLTIVADSTNQAYNNWSSGQISKDEFAAKTRDLYKETRWLKTRCNYNTVFSLKDSDKELVYYDLITNSYYEALIQMNDFLAILPTLEEEKIKTSYEYTNKTVSDKIGIIKKHLEI